MINNQIITWFLNGDPSIRWQVHADLLNSDEQTIWKEGIKITTEGWGSRLLSFQDKNIEVVGGLAPKAPLFQGVKS